MISFTRENLDRFLSEDNGEPVVMLNLLRFQADGGRERYLEYLNMAGPLVSRYGAEILYAGDGATTRAMAQRHWRPSRARHGTPSRWSGIRPGAPSRT